MDRGKLSVCKVTFGAEPRDCEVLDFVLKNYDRLEFSPTVDVKVKKEATNPKRRQKEANDEKVSEQAAAGSRETTQI